MMEEEEKKRYCSKIQRNSHNLFGNNALGANFLLALETPDRCLATSFI